MNDSSPERSWMGVWILGTASGALISIFAAFGIALLLHVPENQIFWLFLVPGACIGFCQWGLALKGIVNGAAWVLATSAASLLILVGLGFAGSNGLVPPILEYYNPGCLSASCDSYRLTESWLIGALIIIIIVAIATVVPTAMVLFRYSSKPYFWILGSIIASVAGVLGFVAINVSIPGLFEPFCSAGLILPVIIAVITAPFIHLTLESRKQ